jgi:hypothetical protein
MRAGPPAPFNWSLTSSNVGFAERRGGGGLNVMFHGREDGVLASQLLLLPPGRYRLTVQGAGLGAHAESLAWTVVCANGNAVIASATLPETVRSGLPLTVGPSCPAQYLRLAGTASDMPQAADATIGAVRLMPERRRG